MHIDKNIVRAGDKRLHALDAVRAYALLLGVVLHAAMSFFPGPQVWLVRDTTSSVTLSVAFFVIHMLRMLTFFLIAGFVARLSFERLGPSAFFKDRLRRIGVPLLVGWPILFVALMAAIGVFQHAFDSISLSHFQLMHLWFLYLLAIFYVVIALTHRLLARLDWLARGILHPVAIVVLAAPLCVALYLQPYWAMWFGVPTPDQSLVPTWPALLGYGTAFLFGWLVQSQPLTLEVLRHRCLAYLACAVACTIYCMAQVGMTPLLMPAPQNYMKLVYAVSYSLGAWSWALALVGMAQRFLDGPSRVRRYLADASYWIYLVHLPLVVALQRLVAPLDLPWALKFLLILAVAFVLMLGTYALFVRRTFIGVILNGQKKY